MKKQFAALILAVLPVLVSPLAAMGRNWIMSIST